MKTFKNLNQNSRVYPRVPTRRQKARKASTNRMLENQYGVKFKNNQINSDVEWLDKWCSENGFTGYGGKDSIMKKAEQLESGGGQSTFACPPGQIGDGEGGCVPVIIYIL